MTRIAPRPAQMLAMVQSKVLVPNTGVMPCHLRTGGISCRPIRNLNGGRLISPRADV